MIWSWARISLKIMNKNNEFYIACFSDELKLWNLVQYNICF